MTGMEKFVVDVVDVGGEVLDRLLALKQLLSDQAVPEVAAEMVEVEGSSVAVFVESSYSYRGSIRQN